MRDVFISHADEEGQVALAIARGLRAAGYTTWSYEEDSDPGVSYLTQIDEELEDTKAVVLVISPSSLASPQVLKEVVRAHEGGKPFIPIRCGVDHEAVQRQREWRMALGGAVSIAVPPEGVDAILQRIIRGLERSGVRPSSGARPGEGETAPGDRVDSIVERVPVPPGLTAMADRLAYRLRRVSDSTRLTITGILGTLGLIGSAVNYLRTVNPDPLAAAFYRVVPAIGTANQLAGLAGLLLNAGLLWNAWQLYSGHSAAARTLRMITAVIVQMVVVWFVVVTLAAIFATHMRPPADRVSIITAALFAALIAVVPATLLHALYRRQDAGQGRRDA